MQVQLRKTAIGWEFCSEADLESFVQSQLPQLLQLKPIQQQYAIKGQICDLLCVDEAKRLTVIEFKDSEDRYVIQQLTRYYAARREVQPLVELVDYTQPIQLVAFPAFRLLFLA